MVNSMTAIKVQGKSGFDKSFKNILTTKVGTITPIVSKLLIPGTKGKMSIAISAALPPLASDTFMRADLKVEAFFCPMRLCYGGYEPWLTGGKVSYSGTMSDPGIPYLHYKAADSAYIAPGTLADYLGVCSDSLPDDFKLNIFPFLSYWRIVDFWYRNRRIQSPLFVAPCVNASNTDDLTDLRFMPSTSLVNNLSYRLSSQIAYGIHIGGLAQRNYGDDYFTIANSSPQFGNEQKVTIDANSQFTISALRGANSMQQFEERNNLGSPRMVDYVKVNYGADLSSGVAQQPILLGSASYPVYSKGVNATADVTASNNPFASVGARYGNAFASGTDFVCEFTANEPGYLMVMATLVPEANYCGGVDHSLRLFTAKTSQVDLPNPILENVGNEPIMKSEILASYTSDTVFNDGVFGYLPRYTWHKTNRNQVHGILRLGQSLQSFVAQRRFTVDAEIGTNFLKINQTDLDNVTAVSADLSNYGCWIDSYISMKVVEPLAESALPSLQDPAYEHGHTVMVKTSASGV